MRASFWCSVGLLLPLSLLQSGCSVFSAEPLWELAKAGGALAADVFIVERAGLTLGKTAARGRNAVGVPMIYAEAAAAFRVNHDEREALGARGHVLPFQRRRNVFTDAVRIALDVAGEFHRHHADCVLS